MRIFNKSYKLHYVNESITNNKNNSPDKQLLANRSETVIRCRTSSPNDSTALVEKQILDNNVVIPSAIVNVANNSFTITCINTSKTDKLITTPIIHVDPYNVDNLIETNNKYSKFITINNLNLEDRKSKVIQLIRKDHLNSEETESLFKIISEYYIFFIEGDSLTFSNHTKHQIPTTSDTPIHTKTYRFPQIHESEVRTQVQKLLDQDIIQPSTSPWSSPASG
ncbi:unnamed protein product [Euphydryas editha]|uniref:Uncharacterized protein n=1 Tax=Euphydryas editha TaxID=104508 RepID=A0AAU9UBT0_EUPED|nr:unnamed protein product [Euphydryas editha]